MSPSLFSRFSSVIVSHEGERWCDGKDPSAVISPYSHRNLADLRKHRRDPGVRGRVPADAEADYLLTHRL